MIIYVDFEHECLRYDATLWQHFAPHILETKYRLETLSGQLCLILRYERVTLALLSELNPAAVIFSGNYTGFHHYAEADLAGLRAVFREPAWPTLAICGSFHMLAQSYGADIGPMESPAPGASVASVNTPLPAELTTGRPDLAEPERKQELGFTTIRLSQPHPLFDGLGSHAVVFAQHSWEVKSPPPGFQVVAATDRCPIQMFIHNEKPLFGTQFHPERYIESQPDGQRILQNFFKLAGVVA